MGGHDGDGIAFAPSSPRHRSESIGIPCPLSHWKQSTRPESSHTSWQAPRRPKGASRRLRPTQRGFQNSRLLRPRPRRGASDACLVIGGRSLPLG